MTESIDGVPEGVIDLSFCYGEGRSEPSSASPEGRIIYQPILPVILRTSYTDKQILCNAVVDSGSDCCSFPYSFMEPLGIERGEFEISTTADRKVSIYYGIVSIGLGFIEPYNVRVGFHPGHICMLGQDGFFDRFWVSFNRKAKCFGITNQKFADEPDTGTNRR
jgi:hypothetical protein